MSELVSVSIVVAAAAYVGGPAAQAFLKKVSGPLADEIGHAIADPLREWRARRAAAAVSQARTMLQSADIDAVPVPPRLLVPIAEAASLEDDPRLTALWSALLANAAAGQYGANVHPRFVAVLQELTPADAQLLEYLGRSPFLEPGFPETWWPAGLPRELTREHAGIAVDALISLGLANKEGSVRVDERNIGTFVTPEDARTMISRFGRAFLAAVTPPTKVRRLPGDIEAAQ